MNMRKLITSKKTWIFILFITLHIVLFNVNYVEWGDSYRILRASEFIREGSYPIDEKRPPIYSLLLATRPDSVDAVTYGRVVMLLLSTLGFFLFESFFKQFVKERKHIDLGLILFTLNPVWFYWSLRIMADVPFSLLALLVFYLLTRWKNTLNLKKSLLIGLLTGLSILTRFEGYILFGSIGLGFLLSDSNLMSSLKKNFMRILSFVIGTLTVTIPYWLYSNPLKSSYFVEPSGRTYDLKMLLVFVISLLFIFGFTNAFSSLFFSRRKIMSFFKDNKAISAFIAVELLLVVVWPAAIPRLFVSILPYLILLLVIGMSYTFDEKDKKQRLQFIAVSFLLLFVYALFQYILKQQFLILSKPVFIGVIILNVLMIASYYFNKTKLYYAFLVMSMLSWSISTVWLHKDVYRSLKDISLYARENVSGTILHNDINSIIDWHINYENPRDDLNAVFRDEAEFMRFKPSYIVKNGGDYIIMTNEHAVGMQVSISGKDELTLVKEFKYNLYGTDFFSKLIKFERKED